MSSREPDMACPREKALPERRLERIHEESIRESG